MSGLVSGSLSCNSLDAQVTLVIILYTQPPSIARHIFLELQASYVVTIVGFCMQEHASSEIASYSALCT